MEDLRQRLANDTSLFAPNVIRKDQKPLSAISISSTSSASSVPPTKMKGTARAVIISDDEEDENTSSIPRAPVPSNQQENGPAQYLNQAQTNVTKSAAQNLFQGPAKPIHIPSNSDLPPPPRAKEALWETFEEPEDNHLYDPKTSAQDAERALRDLVAGSVADEDNKEINEEDTIVPGFRDNIRLLPHQVLGRQWMAQREEGKKFGGILADDMGLGKTIQTLTRIVDGKPKKSDKKEGWAPTTLVVCPVSLVGQWASEIQKMAIGLRVIEHHGAGRTTDPAILSAAHVVVTSYSIVASEHAAFVPPTEDPSSASEGETFGRTVAKKKRAVKRKDALFRVHWFRIVLDEAHNIKNRNTKAALGCCALKSKYRWCLTGTPLQNNVEELYSLFKFLGIKPLNDWQHFNEAINKPVKSGRSVRAMKRLQIVLKSIMLRRTKDHILNGKPILQLPDRKVEIVPCEFDADEKAFYRALETKMSSVLDELEGKDQAKNNYTSILTMLLRLRQACNHPGLVSKDYRTDKEAIEPKAAKNMDDEDDDELAAMFGSLGMSGGRKCQLCQMQLTESNTAKDEETSEPTEYCTDCVIMARKARRKSLHAVESNLPPDSAKIRKVLELMTMIDDRSEAKEKTIIFSQFTSMLDLLQPFLDAEGIKYVRYDGSMTKDKREESLAKIRGSKSTRCILISFKAGSTGLNLTACNNVILLDMWWNPALEDQAFDRAHRFGQERNVFIYKLTIEDTVEERILALQEQKRKLAQAALSGDKIKNMKLGLDDLMALFRRGSEGDDEDE